jgi:hypothetical protein
MGAAGSRQPASPACESEGRLSSKDGRASALGAVPGACIPVSKVQEDTLKAAYPSRESGGQPVAGAPMPSVMTDVHAACRSSSPIKEIFDKPGASQQGVAGAAKGIPLRERRKARKTTNGLIRKLQREALLLAFCRIALV